MSKNQSINIANTNIPKSVRLEFEIIVLEAFPVS